MNCPVCHNKLVKIEVVDGYIRCSCGSEFRPLYEADYYAALTAVINYHMRLLDEATGREERSLSPDATNTNGISVSPK